MADNQWTQGPEPDPNKPEQVFPSQNNQWDRQDAQYQAWDQPGQSGQQPYSQDPYPQSYDQGYYPPQEQKKSNKGLIGLIIALTVLLLVVALGAFGVVQGWFAQDDSPSATDERFVSASTEADDSDTEADPDSDDGSDRESDRESDRDSDRKNGSDGRDADDGDSAQDSSRGSRDEDDDEGDDSDGESGRSRGGDPEKFENYEPATDVTSEPFAENVHQAFRGQYLKTGKTTATIIASSPVTGETYEMDCRPEGDEVSCSGGNNAVVRIF